MKTNEITEGNRTLAEFMTGRPKSSKVFFDLNCVASDLKYSTSWDWLMPVVEKCYSTNLYYRYKDESCRQFFEGGIELTTNIDDVWLACVEFVKWLNEQQ